MRSQENASQNTIHLSAADATENNRDAEVRLVKKQQQWGLTGVSATVVSHRACPRYANIAAHYNYRGAVI